MLYRQLGRTDLRVSEVAIGCSGFWGDRRCSEQRAAAVIYEAFDQGVNFFDTGHNYSNFNAEPRLGRCLKTLFKTHQRSDVIVSSKAGSILGRQPVKISADTRFHDFSPASIEASCLASIQNLQCEYLDLFQLHGINETQLTDELLDKLTGMRQQGLFRYLGINTHNRSELEFACRRADVFDMVLLDYNLVQLDRQPMVAQLAQAGLGVVAGTVLAQGHLVSNRIGSLSSGAYFWYLARTLLKPTTRALAQVAKNMRQVLHEIDEMTPAQAAFAYILADQNVASCVFGSTQIENCREVIAASGKILSEQSKQRIRQAFVDQNRIVSF